MKLRIRGMDAKLFPEFHAACGSVHDLRVTCPANPVPFEMPTEPPEMVNHPPHYNANPSGVEAITVVEWMTFNVGNAVKYLWRVFDKGDPVENLRKAVWYCEREIKRLEAAR